MTYLLLALWRPRLRCDLEIQLWLSLRFSRRLVVTSLPEAKRHFWKAHSGGLRSAPVRPGSLTVASRVRRPKLARTDTVL